MNFNEYKKEAMRTSREEFTKEKALCNAALGLAGEVGEVVDIIKKHIFQGHELDKQELKKELGDSLWYYSYILDTLDLDIEEIMQMNIEKLTKRYPTRQFREKDSVEREE